MITADTVFTVTEITRRIRNLIEDNLPLVWVEGEISNFKHHTSGHRYFTLKDDTAQLSCVLWRTRNTGDIVLDDGIRILAFGKITVYEPQGRYQMDVQNIQPAGVGRLQLAFEALKRKLAAEGLFDEGRKRPLPQFPRAIGIATSRTGAAIHDIVWGFRNRFPAAQLYLMPVAVQGEGAAAQIASAIEHFNRLKLVDVIVIGRGGGSLEDLWTFNEETLVRAVATSEIPVVSAVGHEVDVTLCDFAADLRAPTPTAVAALVVPDRRELLANLIERRDGLVRALERMIQNWRERLSSVSNSYGFRRTIGRVGEERLRLEELNRQMEIAIKISLERNKTAVAALMAQLNALAPTRVLERGFSIVRGPAGEIIKNSRSLTERDEVNIQFYQGAAQAVIKELDYDR